MKQSKFQEAVEKYMCELDVTTNKINDNFITKQKWNKLVIKTKIRAIIQSYNTRISTHLANQLGLPADVILKHINNMSENKRFKEDK